MAINLIKIGREYSSPSHKEFVMDSVSDVANLPTLSECAPGSFATVIGGDKYILKPSGKWAVHNDAAASGEYDDTELRELVSSETARATAKEDTLSSSIDTVKADIPTQAALSGSSLEFKNSVGTVLFSIDLQGLTN